MVNKSLALLAFTALAAAAPSPQLGGLGGLTGLLSPGSKSSGSGAKNSGEPMPDTLSYNKPFEDEEDPHTSSFARSYVPTSTVVQNVASTSRAQLAAYTTSPVTNKNEQPPTYGTQQQKDETPATYEQPQQQKDETPKTYEQPQQQQEKTPDTYEAPKQQQDQTPKTYEAPKQQQEKTPDTYEQPQQQQEQTPKTYEQPQQQQDQTPDTYEEPQQQQEQTPKTYEAPKQQQEQTPKTYEQPQQQQDQTPDAYEEPQQQQQQQETPAPYKRSVEQGYGKAEFEKQAHEPSTTAAAACAAKSSDVESYVSSNLPAISSANPAFGKAAESYLSHVSSTSSLAAAKQTSSAWSAKAYTTPVAQPAVKSVQEDKTSTTTIPTAAATTPLRDSAVPSDAKIFINPLANTTTATPAAEVDAKKNSAYAAESTAPVQDVAPAVTSSALPYYPTTTGVANMTSGIAAASTGVAKSNNTVPEFEGAASSSHLMAGSAIAAALAAFAFL